MGLDMQLAADQASLDALLSRQPAFRIFHTAGGDTFSPDLDTAASGGGSVTKSQLDTTLSTDGTADALAYLRISTRPFDMATGALLGQFLVRIDQAIGSHAHEHIFGFVSGKEGGENDLAGFRPSVGQDTAGNVRVDNGGTDTDGSITYPTLNGNVNFYAIVVDLDDSETRFYVNKDPVSGSPDATLAAVPGSVPPPGFVIEDTSGTGSDSSEALRVQAVGLAYYPGGL